MLIGLSGTVRVFQKVRANGSKVKLLRSSGMSIRLSLGSLLLVLDLTMQKGVDLLCIN